MDWPLRDALVAYVERRRSEAREDYRTTLLMWATGVEFAGSNSCPAPPSILDLP